MQTSPVLYRHVTCDIPTNNLFVKPTFPFLPSITEARIFVSSGGTRLADHAFSNIVIFFIRPGSRKRIIHSKKEKSG